MSLLAPSTADFPTLPHTGVAYLDSGATSQTPIPVIEAMDAYYREYRASVHRGIYPIAALATEAYETARDKVAAFAGSTPGETIFTRNATEAINLVAYSWGSANVRAGDLIVITEMEHHSNLVPWQLLAERTGAELGVRADRRRGPADRGGARRAARPRPEARRLRARLQRARHHQPGRRHRRPRARRRRGRARRRRPGRAAPSPRRARRSARTSTPGRRTRPTGRPASACCTAGARCSRRCRRSSAAAT